MEKDKASTPNKEKDIHVGRASEIEMANEPTCKLEKDNFSSRNMENDIKQASASNMEEDKANSPNKEKDIHVGSASDIEIMAKDISHKLYTEVGLMSFLSESECCIYRVPKPLRDVNLKAYAPLLISIGPFHRENKMLAMEKEKWKYFKTLTERDGMDEKKMCEIVIIIKNEEERLRRCYSEKSILMESSDFVEMILLDAVFIIQFFLESNDDKKIEHRMTFDIREDLMLLENQIPLFIIQDIYDRVYPRSQPFLDLARCYFEKYSFLKKVETSPGVKGSRHLTDLLRILMWCKTSLGVEIETSAGVEIETILGVEKETSPAVEIETSAGVEIETSLGVEIETRSGVEKETSLGEKRSRHFTELLRNLMFCKTSPGVEKETSSGVKKETSPGVEGSRHFTDLLRNLMLSRAIPRSYIFDPVKLKYTAVMLHKAGVRFQATRDKCLVNITFDKGVLKIPQVEIDYNFDRLVRNIMAMEQCLYEHEAYICSYIKFMDHLIDSAEDMGLLVENGIILHWLGDDAAVSNMINNFCENIGDNYTCFGDISQELNAHYENRWNHRKATLKLVYFPNIWRGTATVAAAILLILTFIQTMSSVKSFY